MVQGSQQEPKVSYTSDQGKVVVNQVQGASNVKVEQDGWAIAAMLVVGAVAAAPAAAQAATQPVPASLLLRMNVVNTRSDMLGEVEHVLTHAADNKVFVVIGHGGFLGMGEKQVALPVGERVPARRQAGHARHDQRPDQGHAELDGRRSGLR